MIIIPVLLGWPNSATISHNTEKNPKILLISSKFSKNSRKKKSSEIKKIKGKKTINMEFLASWIRI
jgi:hypothetical protein